MQDELNAVLDRLNAIFGLRRGDIAIIRDALERAEREREVLRAALRTARAWMFCEQDESTSRQEQYQRDLIEVHAALSGDEAMANAAVAAAREQGRREGLEQAGLLDWLEANWRKFNVIEVPGSNPNNVWEIWYDEPRLEELAGTGKTLLDAIQAAKEAK